MSLEQSKAAQMCLEDAKMKSGSEVLCFLFGCKWQGCKCTRCGKTRDQEHDYRPVPGRCVSKCAVCGKDLPQPHRESPDHYELSGTDAIARCALCKAEIWRKKLYLCEPDTILTLLRSTSDRTAVTAFFFEYMNVANAAYHERRRYRKDVAKAVMGMLSHTELMTLLHSGKMSHPQLWTLTGIAEDEVLADLCEDSDPAISDKARHETRMREDMRRRLQEETFCPDGNPHEFGEPFTEWEDRGFRDDDDMKAREWALAEYVKCSKCGFKKLLGYKKRG
ncbi:MAG: hypothetical protein QM296_00960 [Bacillota bacterium]|nr:hypothetical protein [Bacillota bacterium]